MICFLISVILMISSYFLMISFIYSVLTNIIIIFSYDFIHLLGIDKHYH